MCKILQKRSIQLKANPAIFLLTKSVQLCFELEFFELLVDEIVLSYFIFRKKKELQDSIRDFQQMSCVKDGKSILEQERHLGSENIQNNYENNIIFSSFLKNIFFSIFTHIKKTH